MIDKSRKHNPGKTRTHDGRQKQMPEQTASKKQENIYEPNYDAVLNRVWAKKFPEEAARREKNTS